MVTPAPAIKKIPITHPHENRLVKSLIFGPSGHGKTTLLGTANDDERTSPMLLLSFEGGTASLVGRDIDVVEIRSWDDYNEAYAFLADGNHDYKSIGIDSISETYTFALLTRLADPGKDRKIPDLLEQGDYGIALVQMRKFLRAFRDLPFHVFVSSLSKDEQDSREGLVKKPALGGTLSDEAPGIFDSVTYLGMGSGADGIDHRYLCIANVPKLRIKTRSPIGVQLPDMIEDPTIGKLLDALRIPMPSTAKSK